MFQRELDWDECWFTLADDPHQLVEAVVEAYPKLVKEYIQNCCTLCGESVLTSGDFNECQNKREDETGTLTEDYCAICGSEQ